MSSHSITIDVIGLPVPQGSMKALGRSAAGRTSYAYPEPLQQQEQALKEAQRLAVATGAATEKHGKAFWTIKPGRS